MTLSKGLSYTNAHVVKSSLEYTECPRGQHVSHISLNREQMLENEIL